jgi:hypothetical protein
MLKARLHPVGDGVAMPRPLHRIGRVRFQLLISERPFRLGRLAEAPLKHALTVTKTRRLREHPVKARKADTLNQAR